MDFFDIVKIIPQNVSGAFAFAVIALLLVLFFNFLLKFFIYKEGLDKIMSEDTKPAQKNEESLKTIDSVLSMLVDLNTKLASTYVSKAELSDLRQEIRIEINNILEERIIMSNRQEDTDKKIKTLEKSVHFIRKEIDKDKEDEQRSKK